jgi:hypothetical protein
MKMLKTLTLIGALAAGSSAMADTINGTIQFRGDGSATVVAGVTTFTPSNPWDTIYTSGDYSGVPLGTDATKSPIAYTGTGLGATLVAPVTPEWTFTLGGPGGTVYSFNLTTLTSALTSAGSVSMSGVGVAHIDGFEDTVATWSLQGTGNGFSFEAAAQSTSAFGERVPDGGTTAALLGVGILGLGALRRKA